MWDNLLGPANASEQLYNDSLACHDIHACLPCLALACVWSSATKRCAVTPKAGSWLSPGMDMQLCPEVNATFSSSPPPVAPTGTNFTIGRNGTNCAPTDYLRGPPNPLPHHHDNWNNPVSLSLLLLLAVLITANILYVIRKVTKRLLQKHRRRGLIDQFPLTEGDMSTLQRF